MLRKLSPSMAMFAVSPLLSKRYASDYLTRHVGHMGDETQAMLATLGYKSLDDLMTNVLPVGIARPDPLKERAPLSETKALSNLCSIMSKNKILKSMIGHGYYETITPPTILRNVLENPNWYTPYTPYQAEISQGRIESLLNYQTVITDMVKMDFANSSLLDQATAAGEAMYLAFQAHKHKKRTFFVYSNCFPSIISMVKTRAEPLGINVVVGNEVDLENSDLCGFMVQTPDATGGLHDYSQLFAKAREANVISCCNTDIMATAISKPAGEMGADCVIGSVQRLGLPLGYGGPHCAFFAVRNPYTRVMPGRLIGISRDCYGKMALRMALQTREQHIKREKATSNICTAQALLASLAAFYAIYHGPKGIQEIANEIHTKAKILAEGLAESKNIMVNKTFFDTITFQPVNGAEDFCKTCIQKGINVFLNNQTNTISVSIDEATEESHIVALLQASGQKNPDYSKLTEIVKTKNVIPESLKRTSSFLTARIFNELHSETAIMRYIHSLARKDYGLTHGMIPLGSCTMKLNPAAGMLPLSWPTVGNIHPMVPDDQALGYKEMCFELQEMLKDVTGFSAVSLQPNSGANGEYTGLRVIRAYHHSRGDKHRNVCLIPRSAHGTNPASAVLAGMQLEIVSCREDGSIDIEDFEVKLKKHEKNLSCAMITYPSTYGLYDKDIKKLSDMIHKAGGQVYIDGANLNAQVGWTSPMSIGGDVCHMNLHKTFSIPHGGGGPGCGPIAVAEHLAPFLPNTIFGPNVGGSKSFGQSAQAAYGSASILTISYMYMKMLGSHGLKMCTSIAVLNANYLKKRLENDYSILFKDEKGHCAHEFIIDLRQFKKTADLQAEDIAKRLMDYGFHAPTLAFPVAGTLMVEPTESETKYELDRFADAMLKIRNEIKDIESGKQPKGNNLLTNAPHTAEIIMSDKWDRPYTREQAAFPTQHTKNEKFWPTVSRIDGVFGDRNLICNCGNIESWGKNLSK